MRFLIVSIVLLAGLTFLYLPAILGGEAEEEARQQYEKALRVYSAEDYLEALSALDKIITAYPQTVYSDRSAYLTRLILQHKMSLNELKKTAEICDKIPGLNTHYVQGIVYQREGEREKAFEEFQTILIDPAMKKWWLYAKEMVQSYQLDMQILKRAPAKSIKMFESMLEIGDTSLEELFRIYENMASLCEEAKMYDKNISLYTKMIELAPEDRKLTYYERLGNTYIQKGERENAIAVWNKITAMNPDISILERLARSCADYNMLEEAEEIYKKIIDMKPAEASYYQGLARLYEKQKKYDKAIAMYNEAYKLAAESTKESIYRDLMDLYNKAGMLKEVIVKKEAELTQVEDKLLQAYKKAALSYEKKEEYKKAVQMYRKALVLSPEDEDLKDSLNRLVALMRQSGIKEDAENQQKEASSQDADVRQLEEDLCRMYMEMAMIYGKRDYYEKVMDMYEEAYRINPDDPELNKRLLNFLRLDRGDYIKRRLGRYKYIIDKFPDLIGKYQKREYGEMLVKGQMYDQALESFLKTRLECSWDKWEAPYFRKEIAACLRYRGDIDLCYEHFIDQLCGITEDNKAHWELGLILEKKGMYPEAISELKKASLLQPKSIPIYEKLAELYAKVKLYDRAVSIVKQALKIEPENEICQQLLKKYKKNRVRTSRRCLDINSTRRIRWQGYSQYGQSKTEPSCFDDMVYYVDDAPTVNRIWAASIKDGLIRWKFITPQYSFIDEGKSKVFWEFRPASVIQADRDIVVSIFDVTRWQQFAGRGEGWWVGQYIYAFYAKTGEVVWDRDHRCSGITHCQISNGLFYFVKGESMHALNVADGYDVWSFKLEGPGERAISFSISDKIIYIVSSEGNFYQLDALTGKLNSKKNLGAVTTYRTALWSKKIIFLISKEGSLYSHDISTGEMKWKFESKGKIAVDPVAFEKTIYFAPGDGYIYALNIDNGRQVWKKNIEDMELKQLGVCKGLLLLVFKKLIYAMEINNGEFLWRYNYGWDNTFFITYKDIIFLGERTQKMIGEGTMTTCLNPNLRAGHLRNLAEELEKEGRDDLAIELLESLVGGIDPTDAKAYYQLSRLYQSRGKIDKAVEKGEKYLECLDPHSVKAEKEKVLLRENNEKSN